MVLLEKLWDDILAGPQPDHGLDKLKKLSTKPLQIKDGGDGTKYQRQLSMPASPITAVTATSSPSPPGVRRGNNVWRSVFNPGSNLNTRAIGAEIFDKPQPNSPTVYDWLYSPETRTERR